MNTLRDHGITFGPFPTTEHNHISDIEGVAIGHKTLNEGKDIHTGITIIRPHEGDVVKENPFAGLYIGNGHGKAAGISQIEELGTVESLLGLTSTFAVGTVLQELVRHHIKEQNDPDLITLNAFVGEINDCLLTNSASLPIRPEHVHEAIADVHEYNFEQGAIGGGAGARSFGFKSGIGSSSRVVDARFTKSGESYKIGVLMQSNFGGFLRLKGKEIWETLGGQKFEEELKAINNSGGSCMIFIATDAPLLPGQLKRIAERCFASLTRVGSFIPLMCGDYALAWSTAPQSRIYKDEERKLWTHGPFLNDVAIDPIFAAAVDATEEAFWNSMTTQIDVEGYRTTFNALTVEKILDALKQ